MSNWIPEQLEPLANLQLNDIAEGLVEKLNLEPHPIVQLECSSENGVQIVKYEFCGIPKDTTRYSGYNHPVNLEFRFEDGDMKYGYARLNTSAANTQDGADVDYSLIARGGKLNGEPTTVTEIMNQFKEEVNHYMEHGNDMVDMLTELRSEVHADMKQRFPKRVSRLKRTFDREVSETIIDDTLNSVYADYTWMDEQACPIASAHFTLPDSAFVRPDATREWTFNGEFTLAGEGVERELRGTLAEAKRAFDDFKTEFSTKVNAAYASSIVQELDNNLEL